MNTGTGDWELFVKRFRGSTSIIYEYFSTWTRGDGHTGTTGGSVWDKEFRTTPYTQKGDCPLISSSKSVFRISTSLSLRTWRNTFPGRNPLSYGPPPFHNKDPCEVWTYPICHRARDLLVFPYHNQMPIRYVVTWVLSLSSGPAKTKGTCGSLLVSGVNGLLGVFTSR